MNTLDTSTDDKGLRTAGKVFWCIGFMFIMLCFVLLFGDDGWTSMAPYEDWARQHGIEPDATTRTLWHWLSGPPLVILACALAGFAGHLLAAYTNGLRFRLAFPRHTAISMLPGLFYPRWMPNSDEDLARRYARLMWGGPIGLTLLLALAVGGFVSAAATGLHMWRDLLCLLSAGAALWAAGQLVPDQTRGNVNTGWMISRLARHGPHERRFVALVRVARQAAANTPPQDWDNALVEQALTPSDGTTHEAEALLVGATHYAAIGEHDRARELLGRALTLRRLLGKHGVKIVEAMLSQLPDPQG